MKIKIVLLATIIVGAMCYSASALYSVGDTGQWPKSWPQVMEPLRKQATTMVGPTIEFNHYLIPFTDREQFESAWPEILKVKTPGAPIFLVRGPKTKFMEIKPAGVLIHSPPTGTDKSKNPEKPVEGDWTGQEHRRWLWTTYIELVVDGNIVDLNRIPLPPNTPIIDERFNDVEDKSPGSAGTAKSSEAK